MKKDSFGFYQFIRDYPGMSLAPTRDTVTILKGCLAFSVKLKDGISITDEYVLTIEVPADFPHNLPIVTEVGSKIPRKDDFHVNPGDFSLCLGSPIRLMEITSKTPNLVGFTENCLIPYLYAVSHKLKHGGSFIYNELAHGEPGVMADYIELFGLPQPEQVIQAVRILGKKRRTANKLPCPCGCGLRLGKCREFLPTINKFRQLASRQWFKENNGLIRGDK